MPQQEPVFLFFSLLRLDNSTQRAHGLVHGLLAPQPARTCKNTTHSFTGYTRRTRNLLLLLLMLSLLLLEEEEEENDRKKRKKKE
jgi:hypothetical protein